MAVYLGGSKVEMIGGSSSVKVYETTGEAYEDCFTAGLPKEIGTVSSFSSRVIAAWVDADHGNPFLLYPTVHNGESFYAQYYDSSGDIQMNYVANVYDNSLDWTIDPDCMYDFSGCDYRLVVVYE